MACSYVWTAHVARTWPTLRATARLRPSTHIVWSYMAGVTPGADAPDFGRCCYKGVESLAGASGLGVRTVRRAIDELEAAGQVLVEGGRGRGVKQTYTLIGATPQAASTIAAKAAQVGQVPECKSGPTGPAQQEDRPSEDPAGGLDAPPSASPASQGAVRSPRDAALAPIDRRRLNLWARDDEPTAREIESLLPTSASRAELLRWYGEELPRWYTGKVPRDKTLQAAKRIALELADATERDAAPTAAAFDAEAAAQLERALATSREVHHA